MPVSAAPAPGAVAAAAPPPRLNPTPLPASTALPISARPPLAAPASVRPVGIVPSSAVPGAAIPPVEPPSSRPVAVAPKPAPELDQMKVLEGSWRCDGRAPAGPSGPEHAYKSTWKFKRDLDNFWWAAEYQQAKAKANPMPMKARGYLTFDPAAKTFVLVGVDNLGGSSTESTTGWSGDVVTLAGDASLAGKKVPYREVITKKGTREFTWRGEMKTGGDWVTLGEDRCRK